MFETVSPQAVQEAYVLAQRTYRALDVNTETAITKALATPLSLHCWQADDVSGLEQAAGALDSGGLKATGNYPGRARNGNELRADYEQVLSLLPGTHRINLHACYAERGARKVDRDNYSAREFGTWIKWAKKLGIGLDFNPTFFAHPKAADGFTLSHPDAAIRRFWVKHAIACRRIGEAFARALGTPSVVNLWIPDGAKDSPMHRAESLDAIYDPKLGVDPALCFDTVEGKLFGLGSEDFVVGSHEFYIGYAMKNGIAPCLDMGHFHPTEQVHDKLSALYQFFPRILLHLSRGIRWDSDHVVIASDDLRAVFHEIVRAGAIERTMLALDYFDASLNRIAAYVIGARAARKALLYALLEPTPLLQELEAKGKQAQKLALLDELKSLPHGAVWDEVCRRAGAPIGAAWINEAERYERDVLSKRT
jgi:L-rhamnose isomerase